MAIGGENAHIGDGGIGGAAPARICMHASGSCLRSCMMSWMITHSYRLPVLVKVCLRRLVAAA